MALKFDKILGKLREEDGGGTFSGTLDDITAGSTNVHLTTTLKSTYDGLVSNSHAQGSDDQDLSDLVVKEIGKSLVDDDEIAKIHSAGSDNQDLSNLVEKVAGKGLSTNDYTTAEQNKLAGIEAGAEANNISDANATDLTDGGETTLHSHAGGGGLSQQQIEGII